MRPLLRNTLVLGVLPGLVVASVLHGNRIDHGSQLPGAVSAEQVAETAPLPSSLKGAGQRLVVPLRSAAAATNPEQLLIPVLEDAPPSSKGHLAGIRDAAAGCDRNTQCRLSGGFTPASRRHLFCVYRL